MALLDWLGVAIAGSLDPSSLLLKNALSEFFGQKQATIVGFGEQADIFSAALLNGYFSHVLDYDDIHLGMIGHPSVPVIPAILAASEFKRVGGIAFISAFVVGVEIECRIGEAVNPEHYDRGWHSTATLGHFGAAGGAAKIMGLETSPIVNTLGIAGTQAAGVRQVFGTMCKPFHAGKAASNGLLAAVLAGQGFTGSGDIIGGEKGFTSVLSDKYNPGAIIDSLGRDWNADQIIFKQHASCYRTHAVIECAISLRNRLKSKPNGIRSIHCKIPPLAWDMAGILSPSNPLEAKFSQPFCVAVALVTGKATKIEFTDEYLRDQEITALIQKTTVAISHRLESTAAALEIVLDDGTALSEQLDTEKLDIPEEKISSDLKEKFLSLMPPAATQKQTEYLVNAVMNLDDISDIRDVVRLIPTHA